MKFLKKTVRLVSGFLEAMRRGVPILDTVTAPCRAEKTGPREFRIILTQGLNRQIRRMCEYLGCRVTALKRVRVMGFTLDGIPSGGYREAGPEEIRELKQWLAASSDRPFREQREQGETDGK